MPTTAWLLGRERYKILPYFCSSSRLRWHAERVNSWNGDQILCKLNISTNESPEKCRNCTLPPWPFCKKKQNTLKAECNLETPFFKFSALIRKWLTFRVRAGGIIKACIERAQKMSTSRIMTAAATKPPKILPSIWKSFPFGKLN